MGDYEHAMEDDVPLPAPEPVYAQRDNGKLMSPNPFNWLSLKTVETDNGLKMAMMMFCMFRATAQFGRGSVFARFHDDIPHEEDDHIYESPCFKCALEHLELESRAHISDFIRSLTKWHFECDEGSLFAKLNDAIDLWSNEEGWLQQYFDCFSFEAYHKDGCKDCFGSYSTPQMEYVMAAEHKPIHIFMQHKTTKESRLCSYCGHAEGFNRRSFRQLPMCLVFTQAGFPVTDLWYREVQYRLSIVIPKMAEFKAYVLFKNEFSENEWSKTNFKKNKTTPKPFDIMKSWSNLEFVFYTKVVV